jgi:ribonuclease BN (tRNA processing enzyme)
MARIFILGSGTPTPSPTRFGSSYVVQVGDDHLMFDCGPAATHKLVKAGLSPIMIDYLFITHNHFDHNIDLPCFLLTRWDQYTGKEKQLQIFGPQPTEETIEGVIGERGVFSPDWKSRVAHPMSQAAYLHRGGTLPRRPPVLSAKNVEPGTVCSGKDWEVVAGPVEHIHPLMGCLSYKVITPDETVVISGDTRLCDSYTDFVRGADTLLQMCIHHQDYLDANPLGSAMTGTKHAAQIAKEAGVKKLVLIHQGFDLESPESEERAIRDIEDIYDGTVVWGRELMEVP